MPERQSTQRTTLASISTSALNLEGRGKPLGGVWEASCGVPEASGWPAGGVLGGSGGLLGGSREPLGELLAAIPEEVKIRSFLEASGGRFGVVLGSSWGRLGFILGSSWGLLGPLGAILGPSWSPLGPLGALFGRSWRHLGRLKTQIAEKLENATPPAQNANFGGQDEAKMRPS